MKDFKDHTLQIMYASAIRYALGRTSYISSVAIDWTIVMKDELRHGQKESLIKEIENAIEMGKAGQDVDVNNWKKVVKLLKES